jgi:hypothetical protein
MGLRGGEDNEATHHFPPALLRRPSEGHLVQPRENTGAASRSWRRSTGPATLARVAPRTSAVVAQEARHARRIAGREEGGRWRARSP